MPLVVDWSDIALRLAFTVLAGALIGLERDERGRPAGLRTMLLVCLAASLAMIQANLLLSTTGKAPDSFVNFDVMRLPLGILTGMGFIGGGVILRRRGNLVTGVTTAATLWFVTILGLCFGAGEIGIGLAGLVLAIVVLRGVRWLERYIPQDRLATLTLITDPDQPREEELRKLLEAAGFRILVWRVLYGSAPERRRLRFEVVGRGSRTDPRPPDFLSELRQHPGVVELEWAP
jgi:putative Mg2+ transporter-C (MgtC) family protein